MLGPGRRKVGRLLLPGHRGVGNVIDVIDRVQLTGLGVFGTFTGYRMKPGVLAFHDTHMRVCGTLVFTVEAGVVGHGTTVASD